MTAELGTSQRKAAEEEPTEKLIGRDNEERKCTESPCEGQWDHNPNARKGQEENLRGKIENGKKTRRKIRWKGKGGYIKAKRRPKGKVNGRGDRRP